MTEKRSRQDLHNPVKVDSVSGSRQDLKNAGRSMAQDQIGKSINVFNDTPGVQNPFLIDNPPAQAGQAGVAQNPAAQNAPQPQAQQESPQNIQSGKKTSEK